MSGNLSEVYSMGHIPDGFKVELPPNTGYQNTLTDYEQRYYGLETSMDGGESGRYPCKAPFSGLLSNYARESGASSRGGVASEFNRYGRKLDNLTCVSRCEPGRVQATYSKLASQGKRLLDKNEI